MWIHSKAILASMDIDGRQHSATGALSHPFHTQMSLHKVWVAMDSLASTSATHFATVAAGLRSDRDIGPVLLAQSRVETTIHDSTLVYAQF